MRRFKIQKQIESDETTPEESDKEFILSFEINGSFFGMSFEAIHEVVDFFDPTRYPIPVEGHLGVINLRGNVIPIIDPFGIKINNQQLKSYKFVILESVGCHLVGMVVSNVRKIEVDRESVSSGPADNIVSINDLPMRILDIDSLLSGYREMKDDET